SFLNTAKTLRREGYDLVLALPHGSLGLAVWSMLSGAVYRVGYRSRGFGWLFSHALPDERGHRVKHEVENCLELLRALGLRPDESVKPLYLRVDSEAKKRMTSYLSVMGISPENEGLVLIHPGSRTPWVRWLPERFARVADQLQAERGVRIILVGGPGEESISGAVARGMKSPALDLTGRLSLSELAVLASVSRLFIGHSTGPMHLAAAAGIPVVALFGPTSPTDHFERWRPYSPKGAVIFKDVCPGNCVPKYCASLECMAAIQVEDVLEQVESILSSTEAGFIDAGAGS
ncbi:MAG: glycosyltransferase family 9 protein, partial [Deltaproteobacteria bacterium]|nr:glycosyltransferase family 9 protein [Deltaproteobacteria bacterium]